MIINYIVIVHDNATQVKKLIEALKQDHTWFYIHVDRKADRAPFESALKRFSNLTFVPDEWRETCNWGGIGIVKATITILQMIERSGREGFAVLLSGKDYPIKSKKHIADYFRKHQGIDFINYFSLPSSNWTFGGMNRLTHYKLDLSNNRGDFALIPSIWSKGFYSYHTSKMLVKLILKKKHANLSKLIVKKNFPKYIRPYGGDTWWALNTETTSKILRYLELHPDLLDFMTFSSLPDEMLFQSIVIDLHQGDFSKIKNAVTYSNWSGLPQSSPDTIIPEDINRIKSLSANLLFARKFDLVQYPNIFELIENADFEYKELRQKPVPFTLLNSTHKCLGTNNKS